MFRYLVFINGNTIVTILGDGWSYVPLFLCTEDAVAYGEQNYPGIYSVISIPIDSNLLDGYNRDTLN